MKLLFILLPIKADAEVRRILRGSTKVPTRKQGKPYTRVRGRRRGGTRKAEEFRYTLVECVNTRRYEVTSPVDRLLSRALEVR